MTDATAANEKPGSEPELVVSNYDRTHAFLVTSVVLGSAMVLALLVVWLNPQEVGERFLVPPYPGSGSTKVSIDTQWIEPENFVAPTDNIEHALVAVTDVVSSIHAREQFSETNSSSLSFVGTTNFRDPSPIPPVIPDVVPVHKRWSISYLNNDRESYSNMLKSMDIQIGIVRLHENEIVRVVDVEGQFETRTSSRAQEETSLYFQNANSTAQRWDQEIAKELNVDLEESTCVHFYSPLTHARLELLEATTVESDGKSLRDILKTRFQLVDSDSSPNGFELTIAEIVYAE